MSKILVTDDSSFMRRVLVETLKKAGYDDILEAKSGTEVLEIVKNENVDLILLDVIMPNMNGIEVLKELNSKQKVIIVTAVGQEDIIDKAKSLGALGYITKPFELEQVLEEVKKALDL